MGDSSTTAARLIPPVDGSGALDPRHATEIGDGCGHGPFSGLRSERPALNECAFLRLSGAAGN